MYGMCMYNATNMCVGAYGYQQDTHTCTTRARVHAANKPRHDAHCAAFANGTRTYSTIIILGNIWHVLERCYAFGKKMRERTNRGRYLPILGT